MDARHLTFLLLMLAANGVRANEASPTDSGRTPEASMPVPVEAKAARPKGYVFQPEKVYTEDSVTLLIRNDHVYAVAPALANLAGKEVFVSVAVQDLTVPDIDIKSTPRLVAEEIIGRLRSMPEVAVLEVGDSILAIVPKPPDRMTSERRARLEQIAEEVRRRRAAREAANKHAEPQP